MKNAESIKNLMYRVETLSMQEILNNDALLLAIEEQSPGASFPGYFVSFADRIERGEVGKMYVAKIDTQYEQRTILNGKNTVTEYIPIKKLDKSNIIGFAYTNECYGDILNEDYVTKHAVPLVELAVMPKYRHNGVGTTLMSTLGNIVENKYTSNNNKYGFLFLEVLKDNSKAIDVYKKLGFLVYKEQSIGGLQELVMLKQVNDNIATCSIIATMVEDYITKKDRTVSDINRLFDEIYMEKSSLVMGYGVTANTLNTLLHKSVGKSIDNKYVENKESKELSEGHKIMVALKHYFVDYIKSTKLSYIDYSEYKLKTLSNYYKDNIDRFMVSKYESTKTGNSCMQDYTKELIQTIKGSELVRNNVAYSTTGNLDRYTGYETILSDALSPHGLDDINNIKKE